MPYSRWTKKASIEVIEKAHKALALKYHPDKQPQEKKTAANESMKLINEAYAILSDPKKRAAYDETLRQKKWQTFLEDGLLGIFTKYVKD